MNTESKQPSTLLIIMISICILGTLAFILGTFGAFDFMLRTQLEKDVLNIAKTAEFPTYYDSRTGDRIKSVRIASEHNYFDEMSGEEYVYITGNGIGWFGDLILNYNGDAKITRDIVKNHRDEIKWTFQALLK